MDENLNTELLGIISDAWQRDQRPILLSAVGSKLSDAAKEVIRTQRISLKPYIRNYLPQVRTFVISPGRDAATPASETAEYTEEQLASFYKAQMPSSPRRSGRFLREVWAAFLTDIPNDHRRFVDVRTRPVQSVDVPAGGSIPEGWIEVRASDQSSPDPTSRRRDNVSVGAAIRAWCVSHGLNVREFLDTTPRLDEKSPIGWQIHTPERIAQPPSGKGPGALLLFLSSLSPSELTRISFSGDVLLSILARDRP